MKQKTLTSVVLLSLCTLLVSVFCQRNIDSQETEPFKQQTYIADWDIIREKGNLRIITPPSEDLILTREGIPLSFEINNAKQFAALNNLNAVVIEAPAYDSILPWLKRGVGDLAVASLTVTEERQHSFLHSRAVKSVREYLIGAKGTTVEDLSYLEGKTVAVRRESSYEGTLQKIKDSLGINLQITYVPGNMHTEEIIYEIAQGKYDYTLCDSDIAGAVLSYIDDIDTLAAVSGYRDVAWFMQSQSSEFKNILDRYLTEFSILGELNYLSTSDYPQIEKRNTIRFVTRNNAASYWIHRGREIGFDYELMSAFARAHGLNLKIVIANSRDDLFNWVNEGRADIAAATITKTVEREKMVDFSVPYLSTYEVIVTAAAEDGESSIKTVEELQNKDIYIRKGSSYEETLKRIKREHNLTFNIHLLDQTTETEQILWKVAQGEYEATICDDYLAFIELNHGNNIAIGPKVSDKREISWAVRKDNPLLKTIVDEFVGKSDYRPRSLNYNILYNRYFRTQNQRQSPQARADIINRLSEFDDLIRLHSEKRDFDWRAVAALIYQESKFDPEAESWVGALGLMQLMPATARQFISGDIKNPKNNVYAGVRYLNILKNRFDRSIPSNERFNFALASYNAGYGHVLDARRLAESKGLDRDRWFDNVEEAMLLLAQPEYYRNARYGYCRGQEPVTYVRNITSLFDSYRQVLD